MVDRRKSAKKISILHMRRADFRLVRKLLSKVPWENTFEGAEVQCWSLFKHNLLKAQEQKQFLNVGSQVDETEDQLG